jgi:phenylalanyl-tRNA synthetase beta chain
MTSTLLPGILRAAAKNVGHGTSDVAIFETGTVTLPRHAGPAAILPVDRRPTDEEFAALDAALPAQPLHLAVVATGDATSDGWWGEARPVSWADAVEAVRSVAAALGLELTASSAELAPWHPGRCAELSVEGEVVGHAGEVHPSVCQAYGLPKRTVAAEVDLDLLVARAVHLRRAPTFSSYPVAKEDVALVVDASVPAGDVEAALRAGSGELLESIRLFDVYTGDQVGAGKKSLAYALRFRAADRTLKEGEAAAARDAAVALAAERTGAVQRA